MLIQSDLLTPPFSSSPPQVQLDFLFWYPISLFRGLGGGGKAQSLKKIYRPRAIFKKFDPPCSESILRLLKSVCLALLYFMFIPQYNVQNLYKKRL